MESQADLVVGFSTFSNGLFWRKMGGLRGGQGQLETRRDDLVQNDVTDGGKLRGVWSSSIDGLHSREIFKEHTCRVGVPLGW